MTHIHLPNGTVLKSKYKDYPPICEVCGNPIFSAKTKRARFCMSCRPSHGHHYDQRRTCYDCGAPITNRHTFCPACAKRRAPQFRSAAPHRCRLCGYPTHGLYCRYCLTGPEDGQGGE